MFLVIISVIKCCILFHTYSHFSQLPPIRGLVYSPPQSFEAGEFDLTSDANQWGVLEHEAGAPGRVPKRLKGRFRQHSDRGREASSHVSNVDERGCLLRCLWLPASYSPESHMPLA